jgi:hypothetical protein
MEEFIQGCRQEQFDLHGCAAEKGSVEEAFLCEARNALDDLVTAYDHASLNKGSRESSEEVGREMASAE